ncbi:short chain dehydrogenase reductase family [Fusarium bulbicola]|nr:short chain dehydrogenase reductase family [Fusarium bulbicola]
MPHATGPDIEEAIATDGFVKLILCFDGTGNTFSGTNADTNVVKILRKLDRNHKKQFHYYQTGIGTYDVNENSVHKTPIGEVRSKVSKAIDSGFGTTFDAHIMAGYRFLMRYYEPCKSDDRTKAMGYCARNSAPDTKAPESQTTGSRRSETAPLNGDGGSSCSSSDHEEDSDGPVEDIYLAGNPAITPSAKGIAAEKEVQAFSETFCRDEGGGNIKVFFLGLWDCVNSVAMVERSEPAPVEITRTAHHVRHAVAVDERRVKFKPALLAQDNKTVVKAAETPETGNKQNKAVINGLEVWRLWKYIFSGTKVDNLGEPLKDENLQMSDTALEWMIREVDIVGKQHPRCQVHWSDTLDTFKKSMNVAETAKERITNGFMHDTLRFGCGSSFLKVFMWNLIEKLPGIPRWELNDSKDVKKRGWELYRGMPNLSAPRDIPRGAVLHNSIKERLDKVDSYKPFNNHGSGGDACLWTVKDEKIAVDMRDVTYHRCGPDGEIKDPDWDERHRIWQFEDFRAQVELAKLERARIY